MKTDLPAVLLSQVSGVSSIALVAGRARANMRVRATDFIIVAGVSIGERQQKLRYCGGANTRALVSSIVFIRRGRTYIEVLNVKVSLFILLLFAALPDCGQNQTAVSDEQYSLSDF
jgi:hypothetical protein